LTCRQKLRTKQDEEIDCRDAIDMIGQKGSPALGRRAAYTARPSTERA
jgi:hypothetical protein